MEAKQIIASTWGTKSFRGIRPHSRVKFRTQHGQIRSGRVVFALPTHLVLNCGGRYGTPALVDENNYIEPKKKAA